MVGRGHFDVLDGAWSVSTLFEKAELMFATRFLKTLFIRWLEQRFFRSHKAIRFVSQLSARAAPTNWRRVHLPFRAGEFRPIQCRLHAGKAAIGPKYGRFFLKARSVVLWPINANNAKRTMCAQIHHVRAFHWFPQSNELCMHSRYCV